MYIVPSDADTAGVVYRGPSVAIFHRLSPFDVRNAYNLPSIAPTYTTVPSRESAGEDCTAPPSVAFHLRVPLRFTAAAVPLLDVSTQPTKMTDPSGATAGALLMAPTQACSRHRSTACEPPSVIAYSAPVLSPTYIVWNTLSMLGPPATTPATAYGVAHFCEPSGVFNAYTPPSVAPK